MYLFHIFSVSTIAHLIRICSVYAKRLIGATLYNNENNRISNLIKFFSFYLQLAEIPLVISLSTSLSEMLTFCFLLAGAFLGNCFFVNDHYRSCFPLRIDASYNSVKIENSSPRVTFRRSG